MANSYIKTDWNEGDVLTAIGMNNIEVGIEMAHNVDEILEDRMDQLENDMDVLENMHENYAIDTNAEIDRLDDKDIELSDQITALDGRMDDVEIEVDQCQIYTARIAELEAEIKRIKNPKVQTYRHEINSDGVTTNYLEFTKVGNICTLRLGNNNPAALPIPDTRINFASAQLAPFRPLADLELVYNESIYLYVASNYISVHSFEGYVWVGGTYPALHPEW